MIYYFGCVGNVGHYLWDQNYCNPKMDSLPDDFPTLGKLDGNFITSIDSKQTQGEVTYLWYNHYTIIAFWDRSIDSRLGSNSCFVLEGDLGYDEAIKLAKEAYPNIWKRFKFNVQIVNLSNMFVC